MNAELGYKFCVLLIVLWILVSDGAYSNIWCVFHTLFTAFAGFGLADNLVLVIT